MVFIQIYRSAHDVKFRISLSAPSAATEHVVITDCSTLPDIFLEAFLCS